jgi:chromate transporter
LLAGAIMSIFLLYMLLLKATVTTFNGPSSLPVLRADLVVKHKAITDRELNAAVTAARSAPGPMGIYVVSVGYFTAGIPGAIVGWLAMVTPACLVIPLIRYAGRKAEHPRVRSTLDAAVLASAGLILATIQPMAHDVITGWLPFLLAMGAFIVLIATKVETIWVIAAAGVIGALWSAV